MKDEILQNISKYIRENLGFDPIESQEHAEEIYENCVKPYILEDSEIKTLSRIASRSTEKYYGEFED